MGNQEDGTEIFLNLNLKVGELLKIWEIKVRGWKKFKFEFRGLVHSKIGKFRYGEAKEFEFEVC